MRGWLYLAAFFLFSLLGWLWERLAFGRSGGDNLARKLVGLQLPFLWIYGAGGVVLLFLYLHLSGPLVWKALLATFVVALLECLGGQLSRAAYGRQTWNYGGCLCDGYVSFEVSIAWFALVLLFYALLDRIGLR